MDSMNAGEQFPAARSFRICWASTFDVLLFLFCPNSRHGTGRRKPLRSRSEIGRQQWSYCVLFDPLDCRHAYRVPESGKRTIRRYINDIIVRDPL